MPTSTATTTESPEIWILGTVPPPVTGMTLLTEQVVRALQQAGPVTFFDWSTGISRRGVKFRIARVLRILRSIISLVRRGRVRNARLYLVANSKWGLYLTAVIVWIGTRLGYTVYLHHHTYYYIDRCDRRMAWINRMMSSRGVHVVHTPHMAQDFSNLYSTTSPFVFLYPSIVTAPVGTPRTSLAEPMRLGHLSNLSKSKGLDLVLATFSELRKCGRPVRLTLAGTFLTKEARRTVERSVDAFSGSIDYVGPVYGERKTEFFNGIDCFLLPTRSESWGIVLHEAMAAGVPVITYERGCIKTVVGDQAGLVVNPNVDFPQAAADKIQLWIDNEDEYRAASRAAIEQAELLHREGKRTLDEFVAHMFSTKESL